ncbi:MAG: hypothetical protein CIT02_00785 [Methanobacterium sp. BAmetb5]|nr:MAG: hypothetical protein CIT02_00785 [Methanobacterium sp. BAmetb5]
MKLGIYFYIFIPNFRIIHLIILIIFSINILLFLTISRLITILSYFKKVFFTGIVMVNVFKIEVPVCFFTWKIGK